MEENEIIYGDASVTEVQIIEMSETPEYAISLPEAFPSLTSDSMNNHALLNNRELSDQHPISAITGLRAELDIIESLKTVYSDKVGIANYYEWADAAYDSYGYFVSIVPHTSTIKICDGSDIFGVSVANAGFVGGQDDITRNNSYGLIATSGLVGVLCELDVEVGDRVVSNARGYAKKSDSDYGYKVLELAKDETNGETYAIISLGMQADATNALGVDLDEVKEQVNANYKNIISAINVANQAYNKANEVVLSNQIMSDKVDEAVGKVDDVVADVENLENQVSNSIMISVQAKAIAESAATSAASMKNEAVEKANEALADTAKIREEFDGSLTEMQGEIDDAVSSIDDTKESLGNLAEDLEPLSSWESKDGTRSGYSGFVAQSDENTTELALVSRYEYKDSSGNVVSTGLAGLVSQVEKNKTEIDLIVSFDQEGSEGVAMLVEKVSDHDAQLQTLTTWKTEETEAVSNISQKTNQNAADIKIVSSWKSTVEDDVASIASIQTTANENEAKISELAEWQGEATLAIAGVETSVGQHESKINSLTSWQGDANTTMARIEQKADANGAYIQSTVSNMDKYSVGPHSQAYGFTLEQAASVLEEGMLYVPTKDMTETYEGADETYRRTFLSRYLYKWGKVTNSSYGWITVDKFYNDTDTTNTSAPAVYFETNFMPSVAESDTFGYWYTNGDTLAGTAESYEPYTLYKWSVDATGSHWFPVATLAGNSQSRAVSQIRQDANSIEASVSTLDGKYAGTKAWVDENGADIQATVVWKNENAEGIATFMQEAGDNFASATQVAQIVDKNGNINAASIVAAVNEDASGVTIEADHINLNGYVTITGLSEEGKTEINGANIITGTLDASQITAGQLGADVAYIGTIGASQIDVEDLSAFEATIGGWSINEDSIAKNTTSLIANDEIVDWSLITPTMVSPVRISVGGDIVEKIIEKTILTEEEGFIDHDVLYEFSDAEEVVSLIFIECLDSENNLIDKSQFFIDINSEDIELTRNGSPSYKYEPEYLTVKVKLTYKTTKAPFKVLDDGSLYASAANIEGKISSNEGQIAGWNITNKGLSKDSMSLLTDDTITAQSLVTNQNSPVRVAIGNAVEVHYENSNIAASSGHIRGYHIDFPDGLISSISIVSLTDARGSSYLNPKATIDEDKHGFSITGAHPSSSSSTTATLVADIVYNDVDKSKSDYHFRVLDDGSMYASAANISGTINTTGGTIGGFTITENSITAKKEYFNGGTGTASLTISNDATIVSGHGVSQTEIAGGQVTTSNINTKATMTLNSGELIAKGSDGNTKAKINESRADFNVPIYVNNQQGITADIQYMKLPNTIGTLRFVNGILVEYT